MDAGRRASTLKQGKSTSRVCVIFFTSQRSQLFAMTWRSPFLRHFRSRRHTRLLICLTTLSRRPHGAMIF